MGDIRDVITCAKFQIEIFMGYDFTGGRIFDFPIDFSMALTTVQRYCAACDYSSVVRHNTPLSLVDPLILQADPLVLGRRRPSSRCQVPSSTNLQV